MAKFEYWLTEEGLLQIGAWARNGLTDEQIAKNMRIAYSTFKVWKNRFPAILASLKKNKDVADIIVENALYDKATGFVKTVKKPIKVKEIYFNENGKKISEVERIEYVDEDIFVPPDTTAQIFWLKNRKPDMWRDKKDYLVEGEVHSQITGLSDDELDAKINKLKKALGYE